MRASGRFSLPRLLLESIVEVGMAAHGERTRTGEKVGWQEKRSQRFVLPHVHALMCARYLERSRVSP